MTSIAKLSTSVPSVTFSKSGLLVPDEIDILNGRLADFSSALGGNMSTSLTSPQGQLASSDAAIIADKNDQLLAILNQINPDFSDGRFQDGIGQIYFIDRIGATGTTVTATCSGMVDTTIPAGSTARDKKGYIYVSLADATIPDNGSIDVIFQNLTTGPIACPAGELNTIFKAVPGWSGITNTVAGVPGNDEETRANFEYRRKQSVAANARNTLDAVRAAVLAVDGVVDAYVTSNNTSDAKNIGASNYPVKANSIYVGVYGGAAADIADAIWRKAPPGIPLNGETTYTITDTGNYPPPYPEYDINWVTAQAVPVYVNISLAKSDFLPSDIVTLAQTAVINAFNGSDGGSRARMGSSLSAGRFYAGVYKIDVDNIVIESLTLSRDGTTFSTGIAFGIDEIPVLDVNNIAVELVEV